jgi:hypothetical protein
MRWTNSVLIIRPARLGSRPMPFHPHYHGGKEPENGQNSVVRLPLGDVRRHDGQAKPSEETLEGKPAQRDQSAGMCGCGRTGKEQPKRQ